MKLRTALYVAVMGLSIMNQASAEISVPAIFSDNMVLQREISNKVWGKAAPGEKVIVTIAEQTHETVTADDGRWAVQLDSMDASFEAKTLTIEGSNKLSFNNVVVGEVWLCSGQSNMQMGLQETKDADLVLQLPRSKNIRLITVPNVGTQEAQFSFNGYWIPATHEAARWFSAVGYHFGKIIEQATDMPVGLIGCSWGGSPAESWVSRELLKSDETYAGILRHWKEIEESGFDEEAAKKGFEKTLAAWEEEAAKAEAENRIPPPKPWPEQSPLKNQYRPANCYNGMIKPIIGYGMRGCIWYQGESNAHLACFYDRLFAQLINLWRKEWGIDDFSFYWVNLASYGERKAEPGDSTWAELRETQTKTLALPNTGEAVAIDIGEGNDIHPKNKEEVGRRLARIALAKNYGFDVAYESPRYKSMKVEGNKITLIFDAVGEGLRTVETDHAIGFSIAGDDQKFVKAKATILSRDSVEVWSNDVNEPVAVRYAWADNAECNLYNLSLLPVASFRTDDWPMSSEANR